MLLASRAPPPTPATTGLVPVERCSSPAARPAISATTGLAPVERCSSPAARPPTPATTGLVPVGRCSSPARAPTISATTGLAPVERCSSPAARPAISATTGLVPVERCSSPAAPIPKKTTTGCFPTATIGVQRRLVSAIESPFLFYATPGPGACGTVPLGIRTGNPWPTHNDNHHLPRSVRGNRSSGTKVRLVIRQNTPKPLTLATLERPFVL